MLATATLGLVVVLGWGPSPAVAHSPHDAVGDVEVSPRFAEDQTAYTIVREYLLKSTDGGDAWSRLNRGLDNKHHLASIEVSGQDPDVLFASTRGDGVYRSTDAGASWEKANDGLDDLVIPHLFLSPDDDGLIYAVTREGVVMGSNSGGDAWAPVEGLQGREVSAMAFAPDAPDVVFAGTTGTVLVSEDRGSTWDEKPVGDEVHIEAIAASPAYSEDETIFVGTAEDGVWRSVDGGARFTEASRGLSDRRVLDLQISPEFSEDGGVMASTWLDGTFRTSDQGDSWSRDAEGLTTNEQADLLERPHFIGLAESTPGDGGGSTIFLSGFNGLFRSTDGGDSWQELTTQDATNLQAVRVSPDFAQDGTVFVATYLNGALRSEDRGDTWTPINQGLAFEYDYLRSEDYFTRLTSLAVSPTYGTDDTVYAGVRGYLFESTDAGADWAATTPPDLVLPDDFPPDYLIPTFSPSFEDDETVYAGTDSGMVFRWTAGETPEQVADIGHEILALEAPADGADDSRLVAATEDGVYLSSDRGDSWTKAQGAPKGIESLAVSSGFATDGTAFIGTKNGLFESRDEGATWSIVRGLPFGDRAYIEAVVTSPDFATDGTALVSVRGLGLFRSIDGGATYAPVGQDLLDDNVVLASFYHSTSEPIVFSPTFGQDKTVFGIAESTLYKSTDAGSSWTALDIPRTTHPVTRESAPNDLLVIPRGDEAGQASPGGTGGVTATARLDADHTVLVLSTKRVLAAGAAGLVAVGLFYLLKLGTRASQKRTALGLQVACGALVFAVALFFLTNR